LRNVRFALVVAALTLPLHCAAADELTVISFGRADQAALRKAYFGPFQAQTGIEVRSLSYEGETDELDQMVKAGSPEWDVVQVESRTLELGCQQGLFEKLDRRKIGKPGDFIPGALSECGVGIFTWSMALAYDSAQLKSAPATWADLWDLRKYPGKRGLRRSAKYTLEIALLADGVAPGDVYRVLATPRGVDRAFRKLDRIKPDILWWEAAPQPATYLAGGRFALTSAYAVWFEPDRRVKPSWRLAWDESLYDVDSWAIPRGTPRASDAYRFIAFASHPEQQKLLSDEVGYGPTNRKAVRLLDARRAEAIPSPDVNLKHALKMDVGFWIRHGAELEKRFDQWAPPICRQQTDDDDNDYQDQAVCQDSYGNLRGNPSPAHEPARAH
jgi:putative spermidine/putrescine transport system substrate-binding protein